MCDRVSVASLSDLIAAAGRRDGLCVHRVGAVAGGMFSGHGNRVGAMAECFGAEVAPELSALRTAGQLHDVGKLLVPAHVFEHVGPLFPWQRHAINQHPSYGRAILSCVLGSSDCLSADECKALDVVCDVTHFHHERWDGLGYPEGRSGASIPKAARVVAIVDVIDALASPRSYKDGWPVERIADLLRNEVGKMFDPEMAEYALSVFERLMDAREPDQDKAAPDGLDSGRVLSIGV